MGRPSKYSPTDYRVEGGTLGRRLYHDMVIEEGGECYRGVSCPYCKPVEPIEKPSPVRGANRYNTRTNVEMVCPVCNQTFKARRTQVGDAKRYPRRMFTCGDRACRGVINSSTKRAELRAKLLLS